DYGDGVVARFFILMRARDAAILDFAILQIAIAPIDLRLPLLGVADDLRDRAGELLIFRGRDRQPFGLDRLGLGLLVLFTQPVFQAIGRMVRAALAAARPGVFRTIDFAFQLEARFIDILDTIHQPVYTDRH